MCYVKGKDYLYKMNNKINKLVTSHFDEELCQKWMDEEFQKKLKKTLKPKKSSKKTSEEGSSKSSCTTAKKHTPYISFCIEERSALNSKYPDLKTKEITAKLGKLWNEYKETNPEYLAKYNYVAK